MQHFLYAALALSTLANAHYTFTGIELNGVKKGSDWTYFREHTRGYMPTYGPDIASNDFRCQPGGDSGAKTDVLTVKGGDKLHFTLGFGKTGMDHPGPAAVFMSKAPGDVKAYDGSGDWFKAFDSTLCSSPSTITTTAWCSYKQPGVEFVVPDRLPAGEYLIRPQHIGLHESQGDGKGAQYFYSCAQVKIESSSANAWLPTRTVKIPGMIKEQDDGVKFNIWYPQPTAYPYTPGGPLIVGGQTQGDSKGVSKSIVTVAQKRSIGGSMVARARDLVSS
ncbi:hypothetical protein LTR86_005810 [Recurvomyces mirabilis]|nr:hypothetical protein LTR86_005810 [Recurvomyces mirabilis]